MEGLTLIPPPISFGGTVTGPVEIDRTSVTAFQVKKADGTTVLIVDTSNLEIQGENGAKILLFSDSTTSLAGNVTINLDGATGSIQLLKGSAIWSGAGTPEGSVTAAVGSLYLRSGGALGTTLYAKLAGSGNTGWAAIVTTEGSGGHLATSGSAPTVAANANVGTTGTASITEGNDTSFRLRIIPGGTGIAVGTICRVTFANAFPAATYGVHVTPASSAARSLTTGIGPVSRAPGTLDLDSRTALTSGSTYDWDVLITYRG